MIKDHTQRCYRKSTKSGGSGGNCVEWAHTAEGVYIRDSKHPDGPELLVTSEEWIHLQDAALTGHPHPWIDNTMTGVSLNKDGHRLSFTPAEWAAFHSGILAGECQPHPVIA